jgi:hypothetical protein
MHFHAIIAQQEATHARHDLSEYLSHGRNLLRASHVEIALTGPSQQHHQSSDPFGNSLGRSLAHSLVPATLTQCKHTLRYTFPEASEPAGDRGELIAIDRAVSTDPSIHTN